MTTDLKLEAVVIPVADVDRSKAFYEGLGWRLDADFAFDNGFRVVQFTPPGLPGARSSSGRNITTAAPGSAQGLYLVVTDIQAAREELAAPGVEVSDVFHPGAPGAQFQPDDAERAAGRADDARELRLVRDVQRPRRQRLAAAGGHPAAPRPRRRRPDRVRLDRRPRGGARRAAGAHGEHEKRNGGVYDEEWPQWYATYMVAEQRRPELPE